MTARPVRPTARLVAVLVGVLLAGCARIPTSGPVVAGSPVTGGAELQAIVPGPAPGAGPREIVAGFLRAALAAEGDYEVARSFLAPKDGPRWRPGQRTVVHDDQPAISEPHPEGDGPAPSGTATSRTRGSEREGELRAVTVTVHVVAEIDAQGRLVREPAARTEKVELTLERAGGQWRISDPPDQTLLSVTDQSFVFTRHPLYFLDPTTSTLVPDPRWLPDSTATATRLSSLLLAGPPDWLAPAVHTSFPAGTTLRQPAGVQVRDGVARVDLTESARRAAPAQRTLMLRQLSATLEPLIGIDRVEIAVGDARLEVPTTSADAPQEVSTPAVGVRAGKLLRVQGSRVSALDRMPELTGDPGADVAVDYQQERVAVLTGAPRTAGGPAPEDATSGPGIVRVLVAGRPLPAPVLQGQDLTRPSFDRHGWLFSTAARCAGTVTAVSPAGKVVEVEAGWLAGRSVESLQVARDGARAVVASTGEGGHRLDLVAVVRGGDGTPTSLRAAPDAPVGAGLTEVRDVTWAGDLDLVVLGKRSGDQGPRVLRVPVASAADTALPALPDARRVTASSSVTTLLVRTGSLELMSVSGSRWAPISEADRVRAVAYPG